MKNLKGKMTLRLLPVSLVFPVWSISVLNLRPCRTEPEVTFTAVRITVDFVER